MTPRQRYILDHAPTLLASRGTALVAHHAVVLIGAIYDEVMAAESLPVGAASAATDEAAGTPSCPHQEIIALYHQALPQCPRVRSWSGQRAAMLRSRWREHPDLSWWQGYFSYVAESQFLTGRTQSKDRRPFLADLEWLVRPANFARIHEGKYHGL